MSAGRGLAWAIRCLGAVWIVSGTGLAIEMASGGDIAPQFFRRAAGVESTVAAAWIGHSLAAAQTWLGVGLVFDPRARVVQGFGLVLLGGMLAVAGSSYGELSGIACPCLGGSESSSFGIRQVLVLIASLALLSVQVMASHGQSPGQASARMIVALAVPFCQLEDGPEWPQVEEFRRSCDARELACASRDVHLSVVSRIRDEPLIARHLHLRMSKDGLSMTIEGAKVSPVSDCPDVGDVLARGRSADALVDAIDRCSEHRVREIDIASDGRLVSLRLVSNSPELGEHWDGRRYRSESNWHKREGLFAGLLIGDQLWSEVLESTKPISCQPGAGGTWRMIFRSEPGGGRRPTVWCAIVSESLKWLPVRGCLMRADDGDSWVTRSARFFEADGLHIEPGILAGYEVLSTTAIEDAGVVLPQGARVRMAHTPETESRWALLSVSSPVEPRRQGGISDFDFLLGGRPAKVFDELENRFELVGAWDGQRGANAIRLAELHERQSGASERQAVEEPSDSMTWRPVVAALGLLCLLLGVGLAMRRSTRSNSSGGAASSGDRPPNA